jgi:hypothetical protein
MEKAFSGPYVLTQRFGRDLDAHDLAAMDLAVLAEVFAKPAALHRFPRAFAKRMHEMCQVREYKKGTDEITPGTTLPACLARVTVVTPRCRLG